MSKRSSLKNFQRGDTIVEVLVAIAVLSAVLGGAFVSARRSFNATQQAKDRDQAVRLAESQTERLKAATAGLADVLFDSSSPAEFCLDNDLGLDNPATKANLTGSLAADINMDTFADPPYPSPCVLDSANRTFSSASPSSIPYYISIQRSGTDTNLTFTVRVRWERAGGGGREQAQIIYRFYQ